MHEVLGETTVAVQPSEGSFDDPSARENDEALGCIGALDDFDSPFADPAQRLPELVSGIAAIGEDMAQPREAPDDFRSAQRRAVTVLNVGGPDCLRCR